MKFAWFREKGYEPHLWQTCFHTMRNGDRLCRFRHLVAGRRGGKTLSAAWELLYYLQHPEQFHQDAHATASARPLTAWVLTRDYPAGLPALMTFREVLAQAGFRHGVEYKENRGNRWFEFANGSFLAFKTADEPDALRGAGLDVLWLDEAAFIPNENAWNVVRPALSDKLGLVVSTTTPSGKNWFYDEFWNDDAMTDPAIGRVEYWSIDNPYFPREEWEYVQKRFHPLLFKQEYCAAFDSMAGKELAGDWLHYWASEPNPTEDVIGLPRDAETNRVRPLRFFMGVDPAISLSDKADRFAMALIGITESGDQAFLVDLFAGRIPFHEQLEKIQEWHIKYKPQIIGVENTAYQAALAQQAMRLPGFIPILGQPAKGKKSERILAMAPLFKLGRVRIRKDQRDFINEWLDYDSTLKNPKDDCLDAVEMALEVAGAILPVVSNDMDLSWITEDFPRHDTLEEFAIKSRRTLNRKSLVFDETMGSDW